MKLCYPQVFQVSYLIICYDLNMSRFYFTFKKKTLLVAGIIAGTLITKIISNTPTYDSGYDTSAFADIVHADIQGGGQVPGDDGCGDAGDGCS